MTTLVNAPVPTAQSAGSTRRRHPVRSLILRRLGLGMLSVFAVSVIVFWATMVLPGNAATAILGQQATPERVHQLTNQLGLDKPLVQQYWHWMSGVLRGDFGTSLTTHQPVTQLVDPRLINTMVLLLAATIISTILGVTLGSIAAAQRDRWFDHLSSVVALAASAIPEFVVAIFVVLVFAVSVFHWFPAVSVIPEGETVLTHLDQAVLPVVSLVIVVTPYVFRMMRAATIEALESDYAELAELKGLGRRRVLWHHAVPNALAPTVQVIGLNVLYLAGGVVLVETVFNYQGVGLTMVSAVTQRDVPVVQYVVLLLAMFYVALNIATDLLVLALTPRRRKAV